MRGRRHSLDARARNSALLKLTISVPDGSDFGLADIEWGVAPSAAGAVESLRLLMQKMLLDFKARGMLRHRAAAASPYQHRHHLLTSPPLTHLRHVSDTLVSNNPASCPHDHRLPPAITAPRRRLRHGYLLRWSHRT